MAPIEHSGSKDPAFPGAAHALGSAASIETLSGGGNDPTAEKCCPGPSPTTNGTVQFLARYDYWLLIGAVLGRQACLPIPANLVLVTASALGLWSATYAALRYISPIN